MHTKTFYIIGILLLILTGACSKNKAVETPAETEALPETQITEQVPVAVEEQNNDFAFRLWQKVDKDGKNSFFSPYSINSALGMVYAGARGNTATQIAHAMAYSLPETEQHQLQGKYQKELAELGEKGLLDLEVANALFAAEKNAEHLKKEYLEILQDSFGAELHNLDFAQSKETAAFINKWTAKRTRDRIKDIVNERQIAESNDGMVLVNAVYFKADWMKQFSAKQTHFSHFYRDSKRSPEAARKFELMQIKDDFGYGEIPGYQILEMPYVADELAMVFVIPDEIEKVAQKLDLKTWQELQDSMKTREVQVYIPRFRLEEELDGLVEHFQSLGMKAAFNRGLADFSGIMELDKGQNLYISSISHKAFLEVTEEGSEAAAATQVGFAMTSISPNQPQIPVFRADRPFLCMIVHKTSGNILFLGKVIDPQPAK